MPLPNLADAVDRVLAPTLSGLGFAITDATDMVVTLIGARRGVRLSYNREDRSLPPESANAPYRQYEVVGDLEVRGGIAAPWFGLPGGGVQYELPSSVADFISRGILKPVG